MVGINIPIGIGTATVLPGDVIFIRPRWRREWCSIPKSLTSAISSATSKENIDKLAVAREQVGRLFQTAITRRASLLPRLPLSVG